MSWQLVIRGMHPVWQSLSTLIIVSLSYIWIVAPHQSNSCCAMLSDIGDLDNRASSPNYHCSWEYNKISRITLPNARTDLDRDGICCQFDWAA
ncbi:hypothetical protein BD779DRAFT_1561465 [Infundibulicybe gibba]|nr:hypothetical protein BD779DRAFT_1561465 [Infundibulicybe gibba]